MRRHIMQDGQQFHVEELDRGMMLVHTPEEWTEVYMRYIKNRITFDFVALLVLSIFFAFLIFTFLAFIGLVFLAIVFMVGLTILGSFNVTNADIRTGGAPPGVYANGVELPMYPMYTTRLFIPWNEMEDAWVKRSRISDDMLFIAIKESRWRWRAPGRLFGEEGMRAVIERARGPHGIDIPELEQEAPPRLVIYSAEGAKTESTPEES